MEENKESKLELIAQKQFASSPELIRAVDFLNKTLKDKGFMLGIARDKNEGRMTISVYEV